MGDVTKIPSVLIIASVLAFAPIQDYANVETSVRSQTAGIITAHPFPAYAALAATPAVRLSWISAGAKKEAVNALAAELSDRVGVSSCRYDPRHDVGQQSPIGKFSVISGRSPPYCTSRD